MKRLVIVCIGFFGGFIRAEYAYHRSEIIYHRAPNWKGDTVDLWADLYIPQNPDRKDPAIILVHGGGFRGGSRKDALLLHMADFFAKRGFFVASIEYRLRESPLSNYRDWLLCLMYAVQDLQTFVRFLKWKAATGNPYDIDTTRIVVVGVSAGAMATLHAAFVEEVEILKLSDDLLSQPTQLFDEAYQPHTAHFWMAVSLGGAILNLHWLRPEKVSHVAYIYSKEDSVVKPGQDRIYGKKEIFGGELADSVSRAVGISTFSLTMQGPYCRMQGANCHSWYGDRFHASFGTTIVEEYLYQIITLLLTGQTIPEKLRRHTVELNKWSLAQGCLQRLVGIRSVRGECTALVAELNLSWVDVGILWLLISYFLAQLLIVVLIQRTSLSSVPSPPYVPQVLIPVRNEASQVSECIATLLQQTIPLSLVFGDDGSTDGTVERILASFKEGSGAEILQIPSELHEVYPGKHAVLVYLEKKIKAPVFFVADADMRFPPSWAEGLYTALIQDEELGAVCAPSLPVAHTLWESFQRIEWASVLALIAAYQRVGQVPTMIGNSLAMRREAWEAVGGWRSLPPSLVEDYEMLVGLREAGWRAKWIFHPKVLGESRAEPTFQQWLNQRLRWKEAVRRVPGLASVYWILQSLTPWLILLYSSTAFLFLSLGALWIFSEALVIGRFRLVVGAKRILRYIPLLLLYRFVQGFWLLWLRFNRRPIHWKGRSYLVKPGLSSNSP
ncbi:MAG: glycosyltransferase [Bacteroidia bacterium]|nr:glycosyltransferase [Bacteroidia bacterium]MDW8015855.1 glycosyltransferase [Bacteroidia bacterium]